MKSHLGEATAPVQCQVEPASCPQRLLDLVWAPLSQVSVRFISSALPIPASETNNPGMWCFADGGGEGESTRPGLGAVALSVVFSLCVANPGIRQGNRRCSGKNLRPPSLKDASSWRESGDLSSGIDGCLLAPARSSPCLPSFPRLLEALHASWHLGEGSGCGRLDRTGHEWGEVSYRGGGR